jgi:hypothetical protein
MRPEQLLALVLEIAACIGRRPDFLARRAFVDQPVEVVPVESLVALHHLLPLFLGHVSDVGNSRNHEVVYAQNLRYLLNYIGIEPVDRGANHHHRCDTNDDSD